MPFDKKKARLPLHQRPFAPISRLFFLTTFLTVRVAPAPVDPARNRPDRPGPWAIFVKVVVVRFHCDIRYSAARRGGCSEMIQKKIDKRIIHRNEYRSEPIGSIGRYNDSGASAGWGCELKRPGMYGRRIIVTSCPPISQRYPRLCILKAAGSRAATFLISVLRLGVNPKLYFLSVLDDWWSRFHGIDAARAQLPRSSIR